MNRNLVIGTLLMVGCVSAGAEKSAPSHIHSDSKSHVDSAAVAFNQRYQPRETWYEFMLKQFNRDNVDYGRWLEQRRRELIEARIKNPYFGYSLLVSLALLAMTAVCGKQWIDHRRALSITAGMMADIYNQDAYSRQVAQEAIERYNRHIERCNRVIEAGENALAAVAANNELEQLRAELMRVAEERDRITRERDVAREDLRKKSVILADMSVRLEALTAKSGAANAGKSASDLRGPDSKLIAHINSLQEQLYAERNNSRRLRGG